MRKETDNRKRSGWAVAVMMVCALLPSTVFAQKKAAPPVPKVENRAILVRGSEPVKGLPNFGRNSLPAVYGEYRLESVAGIPPANLRVWMTSEALFLSSAAWTAQRFVGRPAYSALLQRPDAAKARLYLFDRPFVAEGQGASPRLWSVLVSFPDDPGAAAAYERFVSPFLDKLSYFLSNARAATDASFPAIVEW